MFRGQRYGGQVGLGRDAEMMVATEASKAWAIIKPFLLWPVLVLFGSLLWLVWPMNIWIVATLSVASLALSVFALHYIKRNDPVSKYHLVGSILFVVAFVNFACMTGFNPATNFIMVIGIPIFCMTWSIRAYIKAEAKNDALGLTSIFEKAGLGPARMKINAPKSSKAKHLIGKIHLPGGEHSTEQLIKRTNFIEGGMKLPPGSLTITPNPDRADVGDVVISDPRALRQMHNWPGPSHPGESIAMPIEVGTWQDGETVEWEILDTHVQIMGQTGSGKSIGAGWSTLGELITRNDVVIFAADITKGQQTLGPLMPALHRFESTELGAKQMLRDIQAMIRPRTDYLAERGLQKWAPGCGLKYFVVWLEEAPDILDSLGTKEEQEWISSLKSARSAGITFVISLQRSDWSQLPTIARGQLARWCFGVADITDSNFGLSRTQKARDLHPEEWGRRYPGMAFFDAPGIPIDRISMPMRTWYWGEDDSILREHADQYPAEDKPIDAISLRAIEARKNQEPKPSDKLVIRNPDPIDILSESKINGEGYRLSSSEVRTRLVQFIEEKGFHKFGIIDLVPFAKSVNRTRAWLYKVLPELEANGFLKQGKDVNAVLQWTVLDIDASNLAKARKFHDNSTRRAKEYGAQVDPSLTAEMIVPLYEISTCHYCRDKINGDRTVDHVIPLSRGGMHTLNNLVPCCRFCNESKGTLTEEEFRARM